MSCFIQYSFFYKYFILFNPISDIYNTKTLLYRLHKMFLQWQIVGGDCIILWELYYTVLLNSKIIFWLKIIITIF